MSRGRKRNRRRLNSRNATQGPDPTQESQASKSYTAGKTLYYKYRVAGPIGKVTVTKM